MNSLDTGQDVQFETLLITGIKAKLKAQFRLASEPIFISVNDRYKLATKLSKDSGNPVQYPLMFMMLRNLDLDNSTYNPFALFKEGVRTPPVEGSSTVSVWHPIPVEFHFELVHVTDDFFSMLAFARTYLMGTVDKSTLSFQLMWDGIPIDVRITVDTTVGVPDKDNSVDVAGVYETVANITVNAYMMPPLEDVQTLDLITSVHTVVTTK